VSEALQQLANALALGSVYALIALGVAILFSILGLINFAHGELLTITAYTVFLLSEHGMPWVLIVPAALLAPILAAVVLERVAFRPVRGGRLVTQILTSFAVSLILQNCFLLFVGARPKAINYPSWVNARLTLLSVPLEWIDVVTFAVTIVVLVMLNLFLRRSVIGLALRAAAENFGVTRLMGVRANRIIVGAFMLSGLLAGIAALFYFAAAPVVTPTSGFSPLLKGFVAAAIGGLGSLTGAVVGGFLLATLEVGLVWVLPPDLIGWSDAIVYSVLIVILLLRPSGLLGERTVAARV
jgi:branched-chain amino acid transport system permease protein